MTIPERPPSTRELIARLSDKSRTVGLLEHGIGPAPDGKYRHWNTVRRMKKPGGVSPEEYWLALKLARRSMRREISTFKDVDGHPFWYTLPDPLLYYLREIDRLAKGTLKVPEPFSREAGQRFIQMSVVEEAITSSQLEGAATTREVAKEMIRTGRKPVTSGERMILNNYQAMLSIRESIEEPLSTQLIADLHATLTKGSLTDYREPNDGIGVYDNVSNRLLHSPPPAKETPARLKALCDFINTPAHTLYHHPVVLAIILHLWFAWIHPFQDGNGRTARALFYWFLLKSDIWIAEYVSISRILKRAPARYGKSFLYTETDENDLTYFILSQMKVLLRSVEDLFTYVEAKTQEIQSVARLLTPASGYNDRQLALLSHALRTPNAVYTIESHKNSHGVTYQTARTDLLALEDDGLLSKRKQSHAFIFRPVSLPTGANQR